MDDLLRMRAPPRDVAALGPRPARLAAVVRLTNSVVFALSVALALSSMVPAVALDLPLSHWPNDRPHLAVVDATGDRVWRQAIEHAAAVWGRSRTGVDLRLLPATGDGGCEADEGQIVVCEVAAEELEGVLPLQGMTDEEAEDGHTSSVVIKVCATCGLDAATRRVVVTHELGHALGLRHTPRLGSVMFPAGGTDQPDPADYATLRAIYDHAGR